MIQIDKLSVSYVKHKVLKEIDLSLSSGKIHGIVGLNGSGKTTLFSTLFGLLTPESGSVLFHGKPDLKSKAAYLETSPYFYPRITGAEYLSIFRSRNPKFDPIAWNELFELPFDELIENYSTGMKKKLALLGIIALDKEVLLLDEPYNGLDLESNQKLKAIILKMKQQGKTLLVTSHILETLTGVCDEIHFLHEGKFHWTSDKSGFQELESRLYQYWGKENEKLLEKLFDPAT